MKKRTIVILLLLTFASAFAETIIHYGDTDMKRTQIIGLNNTVTINGATFKGSNIVINGGDVIIDGVVQESEFYGEVNITIQGDIDRIENIAGDIHAQNVGSISTQNGYITCNDVAGSVSTMNGSIEANEIRGNASTMNGSIRTK